MVEERILFDLKAIKIIFDSKLKLFHQFHSTIIKILFPLIEI